jgi:GTP pyrophosphokinase
MAATLREAIHCIPMRWSDVQGHTHYLSEADRERVERAFTLGQDAHRGQKRASGEEYFSHCVAVAVLLSHYNADADTLCAALLHDSVEDTILMLPSIEEQFGRETARLIDGMTKLTCVELVSFPTLDEKVESLRKMFVLLQQDVRIIVIKLCDRLHNMLTVEFLPEGKQTLLVQETFDIYAKIADRLCMKDLRNELNGLCLKVLKEREYPELRKRRETLLQDTGHAASSMKEAWNQRGVPLPSRLSLSPEAICWTQLHNGGTLSLPVAFVVMREEDCYRMLHRIHATFQQVLGSFEDFINSPQINGYRAVHTTVALADGTRVLCKIRTEEMHAYARQGVTTWCFNDAERGKRQGKLTWTTSLPDLTTETADRSSEFFEGLKSDILGETITIHGPGDRPIAVPAGATALDGAFYCFGKEALSVRSLSVNGKEVTLQTPLSTGASLEATFGKERRAGREWLAFVTTKHAASFIRRELSALPPEEKARIGKELLQETFTREKRGLIEEFQPSALVERLKLTGLHSLSEAYAAIAEGRRTPEEVTESLFARPKQRISREGQTKARAVTFTTNADDIGTLHSLIDVYEKYNVKLNDIRFWRPPGGTVRRWRVKFAATLEEQKELVRDLQLKGARDVSVGLSAMYTYRLAITILIALWGLDPIVAKALLSRGVSPIDLTSLRFALPLLISTSLFLLRTRLPTGESALKRIPLRRTGFVFSAVGIFGTAVFTYLSLRHLSATTYAALITAGTILSYLPHLDFQFRELKSLLFLLSTGALLLSPFPLITFEGLSFLDAGTLWGFGAALSFFLYSLSSTSYQLQESIQRRYFSFIFFISIFALGASLLLYPIFSLQPFQSPLLLPATLFIIIFTVLPYFLYYLIQRKEGVRFTSRYIPLFFPIVILTEAFLKGTWHWFLPLLVILCICWALAYRE